MKLSKLRWYPDVVLDTSLPSDNEGPARHLHISGQSGCGKTTMLQTIWLATTGLFTVHDLVERKSTVIDKLAQRLYTFNMARVDAEFEFGWDAPTQVNTLLATDCEGRDRLSFLDRVGTLESVGLSMKWVDRISNGSPSRESRGGQTFSACAYSPEIMRVPRTMPDHRLRTSLFEEMLIGYPSMIKLALQGTHKHLPKLTRIEAFADRFLPDGDKGLLGQLEPWDYPSRYRRLFHMVSDLAVNLQGKRSAIVLIDDLDQFNPLPSPRAGMCLLMEVLLDLFPMAQFITTSNFAPFDRGFRLRPEKRVGLHLDYMTRA